MAFAIMRHEKLKTGVPINGSVSHITRSRHTPNADSARRHLNYAITGPAPDDAAGIRAAIEERTPAKFRKDAVRVLEFVITASPDWFDGATPERQREFFESSTGWLRDEFGADNVLSAIVHNDESTPHMHALVVPVDPESGRLNAKRWVGGRGKNSAMQSRFAEWMAPFGVERGRQRVAGSGPQHTPVREWYAGHAKLDEREAALAKRAADISSRRRSLDDATRVLEEREKAAAALYERILRLQQAIEHREAQVAAREHRLAILEQQLAERGDRLAADEDALERRQQEIDRAGEQLHQRRIAAAAAQKEWQARRDAWLAEHRPPEVPELVQHLQHLETLPRSAAADYLYEQDSDELYALFTPQDGLTPRGRELMAQYGDAAEQRRRWERTVEPGSPPDPGS